jgi:hypothetical protein
MVASDFATDRDTLRLANCSWYGCTVDISGLFPLGSHRLPADRRHLDRGSEIDRPHFDRRQPGGNQATSGRDPGTTNQQGLEMNRALLRATLGHKET